MQWRKLPLDPRDLYDIWCDILNETSVRVRPVADTSRSMGGGGITQLFSYNAKTFRNSWEGAAPTSAALSAWVRQ